MGSGFRGYCDGDWIPGSRHVSIAPQVLRLVAILTQGDAFRVPSQSNPTRCDVFRVLSQSNLTQCDAFHALGQSGTFQVLSFGIMELMLQCKLQRNAKCFKRRDRICNSISHFSSLSCLQPILFSLWNSSFVLLLPHLFYPSSSSSFRHRPTSPAMLPLCAQQQLRWCLFPQ